MRDLLAPPGPLDKEPALRRIAFAMLPFRNLSGDPYLDYLTDSLTAEVIVALSRFKVLFLVAGEWSLTFKGKPIDDREAGKALGVRHLLTGSILCAGNRIRITARLIECPGGTHFWADHFECALADAFDLRVRIAAGVVAGTMPALN